ncbi:hypothetical protein KC887_00270 [Candidatus Kaiserbacteria bacterium]|nr:hypothetical protein [Candidatus Kaiserbacteria bacterium]
MPAVLSANDIPDLVNLTYNTMLKKRSLVDLSLTKQRHMIHDRFFKGKKVPMKSGPKVIWKLLKTFQKNFRWTGLYEKDHVGNSANNTSHGEQYWAMCTTNYSFDTNEPDFQSDNESVLMDVVLTYELQMYNDWFENLEEAFCGAPAAPPSATNPGVLCGFPFWIQKVTTPGFTGGNPSGFTGGAGGIDVASVPGWSNYGDNYDAIHRDDFISKLNKAVEFCRFTPPHQYSNTVDGDPRYQFITVWSVVEGASKYLDARNDNIRDLRGNSPMYNGIPIERCPALDDPASPVYDTSNPFYGIDWNSMGLYFLNGREMDRKPMRPLENYHNVLVQHMDSTVQLVCKNRRSNFVLSQK